MVVLVVKLLLYEFMSFVALIEHKCVDGRNVEKNYSTIWLCWLSMWRVCWNGLVDVDVSLYIDIGVLVVVCCIL